ncbi:hypothetical protein ZWY2020_006123 [Hordeum vulgare]|nr:hypothetical protein ZWY2020_006123 [Hordeum vulgare]
MSVSLLQPYFLMSNTKSYGQILIGSRLFLIAMAIHLSLRVAPPDLQQGGNSRISYLHVPRSDEYSYLYRDTINSSLFPLTKHPLFFALPELVQKLIHLVPYLHGCLRFQKLPVEPAPISIRAGPIDIPIIKSPVNWWNTSHQPGSISRSGTSIHVPMPIPILSIFANFPFSTRILFVLETRLPIPSFPESPLMEEIEAREGIPQKT